jgi:hypothetical protein
MQNPTSLPRPQLAFRLGVTGTRFLDAATERNVLKRLNDLTTLLAFQLGELAGEREVKATYNLSGPPVLRLATSLAEGSDRLAAKAAFDNGYTLTVILPFAPDDYIKDFPDTVAVFDDLRSKAEDSVVVLDGDRDFARAESYEAAARMIVRNCDVLLAVWNGKPERRRGSTAETIRFALRRGIPVCWLQSDGQPWRWITRADHLIRPEQAPVNESAAEALRRYVADLVRPPPGALGLYRSESRLWAWCTFGRGGDEHSLPDAQVWSVFWEFERWIANKRPLPSGRKIEVPEREIGFDYWRRLYRPAHHRAVRFASGYRSSYFLIFVAAALVLTAAVFALSFEPLELPCTLLELGALLGIVWLVVLNHLSRWHEQFLRNRATAEVARSQQYLSTFCRSLQLAGFARVSSGPESLVLWQLAAAVRGAPLTGGIMGGERLARMRDTILGDLVKGQKTYFQQRASEYHNADRRLESFGTWLFALSVVGISGKLFLVLTAGHHVSIEAIGIISIVVPALSAFFFGVRAYAEFGLLAAQYANTANAMIAAEEQIEHLSLNEPLASQELGRIAEFVTEALLRDVQGWMRTSIVKEIEAGG